jgi:DNA repair photolyase
MPPRPVYISASRRTDIPRFFSDEFFAAWKKGEITYNGGYGRSYTVSLKPEDVLGYIFWSKDYSKFIGHSLFKELLQTNNAIFHYTINDCLILEPNVAPLKQRLSTLNRLCDLVGPERVMWRFDPICRFEAAPGVFMTNDAAFFELLQKIEKAGIRRCYFSFMNDYKKLANRGIKFKAIAEEDRIAIAGKMLRAAAKAGMELFNCCNEEILRTVPGIRMARCIDDAILKGTDRFGVHRSLPLKPTRSGCGCHESRDIGSYEPKCPHGCLYCYANPVTFYETP